MMKWPPYLPAENVKCRSCQNALPLSSYSAHFEHYHAVLPGAFTCCQEDFLTRYQLLLHERCCPRNAPAVGAAWTRLCSFLPFRSFL